jgi:glycosyltransferase involved in cell wall biosynthesis
MKEPRIPVIQLIDGFATEEHAGGAAQFGIQLARHLDRSRYAAFVYGLWRYNTPSERRWLAQLHAEGIGAAILIEQPRRLVLDLLRAAALLGNAIDRLQARVVNSHFERGDLLSLCSKLTHPADLAIVRTMHADQQWQTRVWLGRLLNLAVFPWLFDAEVAISQATRLVMNQRVAARLSGRHATLLYNGISSAWLAPPAETAAAPPRAADQPRIAIIGRLAPQKGHVYFLQAAQEVLRRFPQAEFWVVGHGDLQAELTMQAAQLQIAHAVQFLGRRSDIAAILREVDLVVSASIWEGFPTVILEAMAAQTPVVATDVSGSRELVRDGATGRLVPMAQPSALAQAIVWMLEHPDKRQEMAERAWHEIHRYTLEQTAVGYDQLYQRIIWPSIGQ